jgi:dienelactone hydrolase
MAFPSPLWEDATGGIVMPVGDAAADEVRGAAPGWAAHLGEVDGWPRRPTIVVPLSAAATAIDAAKITLYGKSATGTEFVASDALVDARLVGASAIVQPRDPIAPDFDEVIVVFHEGAITGAAPLPACDTDANPHPAYAAAAALLPAVTDIALAMRLRISTQPQWLPRLYRQLAVTPVLSVDSVEARTPASFAEAAPDAATAALMADTVASGVLALPDYRDVDRLAHADAAGVLAAVGTTRPAFVVTLPRTGTAPFPVVFYQHGGGGSPTDALRLAGPLSEAGFAIVAIDLPEHGNRAPASGPSGLAGFLDFDDMAVTRSSFQQAIADQLAVLTGLDALNTALEPIFGVTAALDPTQTFVMGMSLGGISTSITFATNTTVRAGAMFVGGGGYPEIVSEGFFATALGTIVRRRDPAKAVVLGFGELLLDAADPLAYALKVDDRSVAPRPALFFQATGDTLVVGPANDQWARAFGADLALPKQHAVAGMDELALPASGNFAWAPGGETTTRLQIQTPMAEVDAVMRHGELVFQPYSQELVAHCFQTLLATGQCEAIDTDWISH